MQPLSNNKNGLTQKNILSNKPNIKTYNIINIDIPNRTLNVELSDEEISARLNSNPEFKPKITNGYLGRYARMVTSANTGAVLE